MSSTKCTFDFLRDLRNDRVQDVRAAEVELLAARLRDRHVAPGKGGAVAVPSSFIWFGTKYVFFYYSLDFTKTLQ